MIEIARTKSKLNNTKIKNATDFTDIILRISVEECVMDSVQNIHELANQELL